MATIGYKLVCEIPDGSLLSYITRGALCFTYKPQNDIWQIPKLGWFMYFESIMTAKAFHNCATYPLDTWLMEVEVPQGRSVSRVASTGIAVLEEKEAIWYWNHWRSFQWDSRGISAPMGSMIAPQIRFVAPTFFCPSKNLEWRDPLPEDLERIGWKNGTIIPPYVPSPELSLTSNSFSK